MINEEWNKTQNDAPFADFYDMRAVTYVLPDEMAGLQRFILIPRLNHMGSHRPSDSHSKPYLHQGKNIGFGTITTQPAAILNYEESSCSSLILVTSYDMRQRKAEVLFYTVKTTWDPTGRSKLRALIF